MPTVLQIESLSKNFGGTHALQGADFELRRGEIHALVGENGAGKSTLIKILSGVHGRDSGRIFCEGREIQSGLPAPGIAVIYQDFDLAANLSIADNLLLGREPTRLYGIVDRKEHRKRASDYLQQIGLELGPDTLVGGLTVAQQQMIAIAKAVSQKAKILIMDEPTSALASDEIQRLLELIVKLKDGGTSIVFVSHKLDEVFTISNRITVFRDGKSVGCRETDKTSVQEIISMMVGRELQDMYGKQHHVQSEVLFEARNLTKNGVFDDINFSIHKGEVLGLYGLKGAGRTAIAETIFGLESRDGGELLFEGESAGIESPQEATRLGIGFVPEDRKSQGLILEMSVRENMSLASLVRDKKSCGVLNEKAELQISQTMIEQMRIKTPSDEQVVRFLSGGNQQKVVVGKWLAMDPKVLLLDEPTRGIDIGAKQEIYLLMEELAQKGVAILFVSSEMEEVLGMADRVLVMHEGEISGELSREELSEEAIMQLATRGKKAEAA